MTDFITKMQNETNARYTTLATDYMSKKEFAPMYVVEYRPDFDDPSGLEYGLYKSIMADQRKVVENIINECKEEDIPMWEYFEEESIPDFLEGEGEYYGCPNHVDLDTVHTKCKIKLAVFYDGLDSAPKIVDTHLIVTVEEYTSLLAWQLRNRRANFGDLHHDEPELFSVINQKIRDFWMDCGLVSPVATPIFAADLVELKEDAEIVLGEPSVGEVLYSKYEEKFTSVTSVEIDERVLSFVSSTMTMAGGDSNICNRIVSDINAIAVQNVLGVENYAGIIAHLKENYGTEDGFDLFKKFLDDSCIEYTLKDENY